MKKYVVRLNVPTFAWALVEVEATCEEEAVKIAFERNAAGVVEYEYTALDNSDVELTGVEEVS